MSSFPNDPAQEYTFPENRGKCGFCGKEEGGYAKQNANGKWQPACWPCVRPEPQPVQKRAQIGTVFNEDLDIDTKVAKKEKKAAGIPPSTHRPKVI